MKLDIRNDSQVKDVIEQISQERDELYAVISNAGVMAGTFAEWSTLDTYKFAADVNLFGAINLIKRAIPLLRKHNQSNGSPTSRILVMSSASAFLGLPLNSVYGVTKAGLSSFAEALRIELRPCT